MDKLSEKGALTVQFAMLVLLQPFIDMYRLFVGNRFEVLGISLVELINLLLVAYLALLFLLNQRRLRSFVPAFAYGVLLLIYLAAHCVNLLRFDTGILVGAQISVFSEVYVILRAYVLPILLFYMLIYVQTDRRVFLRTVTALAGIISVVIVATNIGRVGYVAYAARLEQNAMIQHNIFDWFRAGIQDPEMLTSKGWFYSGNQIGLILFMLFPLVCYRMITTRAWWSILLVVLQAVAMMMVSTKTAAIGCLLILLAVLILGAGWAIWRRQLRQDWKMLAALAAVAMLGAALFTQSPARMMIAASAQAAVEETEEGDDQVRETDDLASAVQGADEPDNAGQKHQASVEANQAFAQALEKNYYRYGIQLEYLELLPVQRHPQFWQKVILDPDKPQFNYRNFKQMIYEEVIRLNQNSGDRWLGIGYSTNFPYLERDVAAQNVWFGYLGTALLLGPYGVMLLVCVIQILRDLKSKDTLYRLILLMSAGGGALISVTAGHLFGYLFPSFIFCYILAELYHSTRGAGKRQRAAASALRDRAHAQ